MYMYIWNIIGCTYIAHWLINLLGSNSGLRGALPSPPGLSFYMYCRVVNGYILEIHVRLIIRPGGVLVDGICIGGDSFGCVRLRIP